MGGNNSNPCWCIVKAFWTLRSKIEVKMEYRYFGVVFGSAGCSWGCLQVSRRKINEIQNNIYWNHGWEALWGICVEYCSFCDSLERIKQGERINTAEKNEKIPLSDEKTAGSRSVLPWTWRRRGSGNESAGATQASFWLTALQRNMIDYPEAHHRLQTGPSWWPPALGSPNCLTSNSRGNTH